MDSFWLSGIADWLINLSAGWFAAGVIIITTRKSIKFNKKERFALTGHFIVAILSLYIAVYLKRSLGAI